MNVEFDGLVRYRAETVTCAFRTDRFGVVQLGHNGDSIITFPSEPDMYVYGEADRTYMESVCAIVHRLVFDAPSGNFK